MENNDNSDPINVYFTHTEPKYGFQSVTCTRKFIVYIYESFQHLSNCMMEELQAMS